jgi:hypothetical protein
MLLFVNQTPHYLPLADYFKFVFFFVLLQGWKEHYYDAIFHFSTNFTFFLVFPLTLLLHSMFFPISVPVASLPFSLHLIALFGFLQLAYRFPSCNGICLRVDTARMSMKLTLRYGLRHVTAVFHHGLLHVTVGRQTCCTFNGSALYSLLSCFALQPP